MKMSKFQIVLCTVAAFFASAKHSAWAMEDIDKLNRNTLNYMIDRAIAAVNQRYQQIYEEFVNSASNEDSYDSHLSATKAKIETYLSNLGIQIEYTNGIVDK